MSKRPRSSSGRGSSGRDRSRRPAPRPSRRPAERTTRRRELSFLDMLLISAAILIVAFVAVGFWILLRGFF